MLFCPFFFFFLIPSTDFYELLCLDIYHYLLLWHGPCHVLMDVQQKCLDFFFFLRSCARTAFMGC